MCVRNTTPGLPATWQSFKSCCESPVFHFDWMGWLFKTQRYKQRLPGSEPKLPGLCFQTALWWVLGPPESLTQLWEGSGIRSTPERKKERVQRNPAFSHLDPNPQKNRIRVQTNRKHLRATSYQILSGYVMNTGKHGIMLFTHTLQFGRQNMKMS